MEKENERKCTLTFGSSSGSRLNFSDAKFIEKKNLKKHFRKKNSTEKKKK